MLIASPKRLTWTPSFAEERIFSPMGFQFSFGVPKDFPEFRQAGVGRTHVFSQDRVHGLQDSWDRRLGFS